MMAAEITSVTEPDAGANGDGDVAMSTDSNDDTCDITLSALWASEPSVAAGDAMFARRFMVELPPQPDDVDAGSWFNRLQVRWVSRHILMVWQGKHAWAVRVGPRGVHKYLEVVREWKVRARVNTCEPLGDGRVVLGLANGALQMVNARVRRTVHRAMVGTKMTAEHVVWAGGDVVVSQSVIGKSVHVWDAGSGLELFSLSRPGFGWRVAAGPHGWVAIPDELCVLLLHVHKGLVLKVESERPRTVAISPDGLLLAVEAIDTKDVRIHSLPDGNLVHKVPRGDFLRALAFSPDSKHLAMHADGCSTIVDMATCTCVDVACKCITSSFTSDSKVLVAVVRRHRGKNAEVVMFSVATGAEVACLPPLIQPPAAYRRCVASETETEAADTAGGVEVQVSNGPASKRQEGKEEEGKGVNGSVTKPGSAACAIPKLVDVYGPWLVVTYDNRWVEVWHMRPSSVTPLEGDCTIQLTAEFAPTVLGMDPIEQAQAVYALACDFTTKHGLDGTCLLAAVREHTAYVPPGVPDSSIEQEQEQEMYRRFALARTAAMGEMVVRAMMFDLHHSAAA